MEQKLIFCAWLIKRGEYSNHHYQLKLFILHSLFSNDEIFSPRFEIVTYLQR